MASSFMQSILEREIGSKLNILLEKKSTEVDKYKVLVKGKGFNFTTTNDIENATSSEATDIMKITEDAAITMLNMQADEYDFFNPKEEGFSYTIENQVKTKKKQTFGNMRLKGGQFTNPLQLSNLINATLVSLVKGRMAKDPIYIGKPLINRTGRLANSGFVTNMIATSLTNKTIYFKYMQKPYAVFQEGAAKGSPQRDPRKLFANAITDALNKLLHHETMATNAFNIRIGNHTVGRTKKGKLI